MYSGPVNDSVRLTASNGPVVLPNLLPGDYVLRVVDHSGCVAECSLYLPDPDCALNLHIDVSPERCPDAHDGQLSLRTTGGVAPIDITWADGASGALRDGLSPGIYSVQVEDALGCRRVDSVVVTTAHATPEYAITTDGSRVCANGCDTVRLSGRGVGPFRANLAISDVTDTIVIPIEFSAGDQLGQGEISIPLCLPGTGLTGDTLSYVVTAFSDAYCPGDSVQRAQTVITPPDTAQLDTLVCPEESVVIGSNIFDRRQPAGLIVLPGAAGSGCDSLLSVALHFKRQDTSWLNPTLCYDDSMVVNHTVYDRHHPAGLERLPQMAANGCDSLIRIEAEFLAEKRDTLAPLLCRTDTLTVNGQQYFFGESQGRETFTGIGPAYCDSTVVVDVQFYATDTVELDTILCAGESLMVGDHQYDQFSPSGTVLFPGRGRDGCDSIVHIRAHFLPLDTTKIEQVLCFGDSLLVGEERFDASRPRGQVVFSHTAVDGCDSTVVVDLDFRERRDTVIRTVLCPEEQVLVNGSVYDVYHPRGTEVIPARNRLACDSIVEVELQFYPRDTGFIQELRCPDQPYTLFGETFTPERPSGVIRLPAGSEFGCDSLLMVDVVFSPTLPSMELPREIVVRQGDSIMLDPQYNFTPVDINWIADPPLRIPSVSRPVITPAQNMEVRVEAADRAGCTATTATRILVDRRLQAYVPNIFRPNSDGGNAGFTIFGGNQIQEVERLRIFDRWGNLLFSAHHIPPNEPSLGWDGRVDGQAAPGGVYIYSAAVRLIDGRTEAIKGDVLLVW